jgi:hypothetical protein
VTETADNGNAEQKLAPTHTEAEADAQIAPTGENEVVAPHDASAPAQMDSVTEDNGRNPDGSTARPAEPVKAADPDADTVVNVAEPDASEPADSSANTEMAEEPGDTVGAKPLTPEEQIKELSAFAYDRHLKLQEALKKEGDHLAEIDALQKQIRELTTQIKAAKIEKAKIEKAKASTQDEGEVKFTTNDKTADPAEAKQPGPTPDNAQPADTKKKFSDRHLDALEHFSGIHAGVGGAYEIKPIDADDLHAGLVFHHKNKKNKPAFTVTPDAITVHEPDQKEALEHSIILAVQMYGGNFKVQGANPKLVERIRKITMALHASGHLLDHKGNRLPSDALLIVDGKQMNPSAQAQPRPAASAVYRAGMSPL